jgi:hypothetical protein
MCNSGRRIRYRSPRFMPRRRPAAPADTGRGPVRQAARRRARRPSGHRERAGRPGASSGPTRSGDRTASNGRTEWPRRAGTAVTAATSGGEAPTGAGPSGWSLARGGVETPRGPTGRVPRRVGAGGGFARGGRGDRGESGSRKPAVTIPNRQGDACGQSARSPVTSR